MAVFSLFRENDLSDDLFRINFTLLIIFDKD